MQQSYATPLIGCLVAICLANASATWAADGPVRLITPHPIAKDLVAYPRIAAPANEGERKINAALARLDARVRKAAADCRTGDGAAARGWWERSIRVPMRGPRFLSYEVSDNTFCGGAHPNTGTMSIVYDLQTGQPVDWTKLLPPALTGTVALAEGMDGTKMVTLASKELHKLYLAAYRPPTGQGNTGGTDDAADKDCREAVANPGGDGPPAMMVWLDAKEGGLAVQFDLAHVVEACADPVVIPAVTLRAKGADSGLIAAIEAAHQRER